MGNRPLPECMYNTKLSVQFSRQPQMAVRDPVSSLCAACSGPNPLQMHSVRVDKAQADPGWPVCLYKYPVCHSQFTRKFAYEVGSGKSSIGRNPTQLKVPTLVLNPTPKPYTLPLPSPGS